MLFNSYAFIFAFLPVTITGFFILRRVSNTSLTLGWLTLCSLFFYGWWKWEFLALILTSIAVNLAFAKLLLVEGRPQQLRKALLIVGITFNLSLLGFFKYADFFITNVNALTSSSLSLLNVLLPIGISFITFQKIAFLVDAYKGTVRDFTALNFCFFVTFFPQLIAGPIVHHSEVMPQLKGADPRRFSEDLGIGVSLFIVGLFKKVIIADSIAVYADAGYGAIATGQALDFASAWITVLAYSFQLYFDFSGYSEMALGLARIFGIRLPLNFYSPYKAHSIIEFWRRWHITLSRFLRDYLYIPLGGNRKGPARRYVNFMIVMLLGGLWHGASWNFVLWGGLHGAMLMINHAWRSTPMAKFSITQTCAAYMLGVAVTFFAVSLAWVPFRSLDFDNALTMLGYLSPLGTGTGVSVKYFVYAQFLNLDGGRWFVAPELWPPEMPANYLAVQVRPVGLALMFVALLTFAMPNTLQLFGKYIPALSLEAFQQSAAKTFNPFGLVLSRISRLTGIGLDSVGGIRVLDNRWAFIFAFMFVLSVLGLSRISPFLYFQF